jgi:hypothetical protein
LLIASKTSFGDWSTEKVALKSLDSICAMVLLLSNPTRHCEADLAGALQCGLGRCLAAQPRVPGRRADASPRVLGRP